MLAYLECTHDGSTITHDGGHVQHGSKGDHGRAPGEMLEVSTHRRRPGRIRVGGSRERLQHLGRFFTVVSVSNGKDRLECEFGDAKRADVTQRNSFLGWRGSRVAHDALDDGCRSLCGAASRYPAE